MLRCHRDLKSLCWSVVSHVACGGGILAGIDSAIFLKIRTSCVVLSNVPEIRDDSDDDFVKKKEGPASQLETLLSQVSGILPIEDASSL